MINNKLFIDKKEEEYSNLIKENIIINKSLEDHYKRIEKNKISYLLGNAIKVSKNQFWSVYVIIEDICKDLDMNIPDTYIYNDTCYKIKGIGITEHYLLISAKTIEDFSNRELKFAIGKELYNIKSKNTYYSNLMEEWLNNTEIINIPMKDMNKSKVMDIYYKWKRLAYFSSDNFAYTVCGNLKSAIDSILLTTLNSKYLVRNMNVEEYINQGEEINKLYSTYNCGKLHEAEPSGSFRVKNLIIYANSIEDK